MTFPSSPPLREVTPEERQRSARMFWLILVFFVVLVGLAVALFSVQGRQISAYGRAVLQSARASEHWPAGATQQNCGVFSGQPLPAGLKTCFVEKRGAQYRVIMTAGGNRQYRLGP